MFQQEEKSRTNDMKNTRYRCFRGEQGADVLAVRQAEFSQEGISARPLKQAESLDFDKGTPTSL
jgi:hypothetical protein